MKEEKEKQRNSGRNTCDHGEGLRLLGGALGERAPISGDRGGGRKWRVGGDLCARNAVARMPREIFWGSVDCANGATLGFVYGDLSKVRCTRVIPPLALLLANSREVCSGGLCELGPERCYAAAQIASKTYKSPITIANLAIT